MDKSLGYQQWNRGWRSHLWGKLQASHVCWRRVHVDARSFHSIKTLWSFTFFNAALLTSSGIVFWMFLWCFRLTRLSNARLTTLNRLTSEVTSSYDHKCRAGTPQRLISATKGWYSESGIRIPLLIWLSSLHHSSSTFLSHPFVWVFLSEPPSLSPLCPASSSPPPPRLLWPQKPNQH